MYIHTIYAIVKRLANRGALEDAPRSGRPRVTTQVEDRRLTRVASRNPFRGSKAIQVAASLPCSAVTVRRRLREAGLPRRVARHKPLLNDCHREVRLAWCRERTDWTINDWASTIFSDERTFRLGKYGRVWVSRPVGRAYHPKYVAPSESRGPSVQIWACISGKSYGLCHIFEGTMNSGRYITTLEDNLLPYMRANWRRHADVLFQQDNATCHTAGIVQKWMRRHNIRQLPWPAKSADLSPIENLWSYLAREVEKEHAKTVPQLRAAVARAWQGLPIEVLNSLYESLPTRVNEVIANDGYYTKY